MNHSTIQPPVPAVTIVVPVFGAYVRFLPECLSSIQSQSFSAWEAIVVDDGSEHDLVEQVTEAANDARIRCIRHDRNRGLAAARNSGIRAGRASLVAAVDGDDTLAPQFLERLKDALDSAPAAVAAFPNFRLFGAVTGELQFRRASVRALLTDQWIPGSGTMFRRDLWQSAGGYCEADELRPGNEDWDFWLASAHMMEDVVHVEEPLYMYRQHSSSMVRKLQHVEHLTREFIYNRHKRLFDTHNIGHRFLAEGYARAAKASLLQRDWKASAEYGARAVRLAPADTVSGAVRTMGRVAVRSLKRLMGLATHASLAFGGSIDLVMRFAAGEL